LSSDAAASPTRRVERPWTRVLRGRGGRPLGFVLLVLLAAALLPSRMPVFRTVRLANFDAYQTLAPRLKISGPVVIVAIDDASLTRYGQWPWPRTVLAHLIERIAAAKPAVIGLDIVMAEPDRLSPGRVVEMMTPQIGTDVIERLLRLPSNDAVLAAALARAPTVVAAAGLDDIDERPPSRGGGWAPMLIRGADPVPAVRRFKGALRSLEELDRAARGRALINVDEEAGVVRRVPLIAAIGSTLVPAFATELLRVGTQQRTIGVETYGDRQGVKAVGIEEWRVPTEPDGTMWVHFSRHEQSRFVSASDVLAGKVSAADLARKVVLIGVTAVALSDYKATPASERMAGVEIHAQVVENIFDGTFLVRPPWTRWVEAGSVLLVGALLVLVVPPLGPRYALLVFLGAVTAGWMLGFLVYTQSRVLIDVVSPAIALGLLFSFMVGITLAEVDSHRRALRRQLQREREAAARLAGEIEAARRIQMGSLPRPEDLVGNGGRFELCPFIEPARVVGGDFYDFFQPVPNRLFFLLGDVAGKGLAGCLFMAVSKSLYRSTALRMPDDVARIMTAANVEISRQNPESLFVTLFAGMLDLDSGTLEYASAGHEEPYVMRKGEHVRRLPQVAGPPLCVFEDFVYQTGRVQLEPGDTLCLMTDGVIEATNAQGQLYGRVRLETVLKDLAAAASEPPTMVHGLIGDVARFRATAEPADDIAILMLRWTGPARAI
jgi:adenylate cyclase